MSGAKIETFHRCLQHFPTLLLPLVHLVLTPIEQSAGALPPRSKDEEFAQALDAQLQALSVRAYERLIAHLLRASGYEDVRILRDHSVRRRSHKGRTTHGGVDITATLRSDFGVTPVLVQAKQYGRLVSRRFVDELRGACVRSKARQGLLITTSTFAPGTRRAALEDHISPIHLIDGEQLRDLLVTHRLGIKRNKRGHLALRPRFFRRLDKVLNVESDSELTSQ